MWASATTPRLSPSRTSTNAVVAWICAALLTAACSSGESRHNGLRLAECGAKYQPGPLAVEFDGQDPNSILLAQGNGPVFASDDLGVTWHQLGRRNGSACEEPIASFANNSSAHGALCAVTSGGTWTCSQDGGRTWAQALKPRGPKFGSDLFVGGADKPHRLYVTFATPADDSSNVAAMISRPVRTVGWSDDFGQTWQLKRNLDQSGLDLLLTPRGPVVVRYGQEGVSIATCDADLNCTVSYQPEQNAAAFVLVNPFEPKQMAVFPHEGEGLTTFSREGTRKTSGSLECGKQCGYANANGPWGTLANVRGDDSLWTSQDGGDSWDKITTLLPEEACGIMGNGQGAQFCLGQATLHRSLDEGATWERIELPPTEVR